MKSTPQFIVCFVLVVAGSSVSSADPANKTDKAFREKHEAAKPTTILLASSSPGVTDDHGDSSSTATRVFPPCNIAGIISNAQDIDYFTFQLNAGAEVSITTTGGNDTRGTLYNGIGVAIAESDNANSLDANFLIEGRITAGTYTIAVRSPVPCVGGAYNLVIKMRP